MENSGHSTTIEISHRILKILKKKLVYQPKKKKILTTHLSQKITPLLLTMIMAESPPESRPNQSKHL